jgi:multisubunit Na+/H+ antiporter MnhE subunit
MYLALLGIVLATAIWADAPPDPWYLQLIQEVPMGLAVAIITGGFILWLVAFLAKSFRRTLICAGLVVGMVLLITLALKADAYVLRLRSERLLADVRSLQVRKTTVAEARRVLQKWQKETLDFEIFGDKWRFWTSLADSITSMEARYTPNDSMWAWVMRVEWASRFIGWRRMGVQTLIDVRKGVVWDKHFTVIVQTPPEKASNDGLYGEVATTSRFYEGSSAGSNGQILQTLVHPDYVVVQRRIRLLPYFMGASAMLVLLTPSADPAVVRHFEGFDFSCMTRWFPCRKVAELMPTAWTQFQEDQPRVLAALKQLKCTPEKLEAQARNAQAAAVVEVTGNRTESVNGQDHEVAEFRLVESLRPYKYWKTGDNGKIWVSPWMLADNSTNTSLALRPGQRFILLFFLDEPFWQAPGMWPYPCGVIPWSETNLALVRHAIAEDARANDPEGVE